MHHSHSGFNPCNRCVLLKRFSPSNRFGERLRAKDLFSATSGR
jgi:hypothetical protein